MVGVNGTPFYRFYLLTHEHHVVVRREADCDGDARVITTAARIAKEWQIRQSKSGMGRALLCPSADTPPRPRGR
jgi:hypothetical protein